MSALRLLAMLAALPAAVLAADRTLRIDRSRSYVDIDVKATADSFTGRLERYDARVAVDDAGKVRGATFAFRFADLKTGKPERDDRMIEWLGGGTPEGRFELGVLALAPDGQGHATGRLTFHGVTRLVEFPVNVVRRDDTWTITGSVGLDHRDWKLKVIRVALLLKVDPEVRIRFQLTGGLPVPPAEE